MNLKYPNLFEPFKIGNLEMKNRIVMTSMATNGWLDSDGNLTNEVIDYYVERAKGGTGLIYTHAYPVHANIERMTLGSLSDAFTNPSFFILQGRKLVEQCHAYGAKVFFVLFLGMGRNMYPGTIVGDPVAPSKVSNRWDPNIECKELSKTQIQDNIDAAIAAAAICKLTGCDGVDINGVYGGYLGDQFAMSAYNKRTDEYGQTPAGQVKMVTDVIKGIKKECGENFPVTVRFGVKHHAKGQGQGVIEGESYQEFGRDVNESIVLAKELESAGCDGFLVGNGSYDSFYWLYPPAYQKEGLWLDAVASLTKEVDIPVICPGRIYQPHMANEAIGTGMIDAVAMGRQLLADPYWPSKTRRGKDEEIRPCIGCNYGCVGRVMTGQPITCAVNAEAFGKKESEIKADQSKKVLIIGGGIAGMEAGRIAAKRGHQVTILEKSSYLGGALVPAAVPEDKGADRRLLKWFERELNLYGVEVKLNTLATLEMLRASDADEIIISTGAKEKYPPIAGIDKDHVITAIHALMNPDQVGNKAVIIGGGQVGCEVALWLKELGRDVSILEAMPNILLGADEMPITTTLMLPDLLKYHEIPVLCNTKISRIENDGIVLTKDTGEDYMTCDQVILATGYTSEDTLYRQAYASIPKNIWRLGDAATPANVLNAIRDGNAVGKTI